MRKRNLPQQILLFFKGLAMGAADVVPGVSGGTIAFISGIYNELLASISAIRPNLIQVLRKEGLPSVWRQINGNFLLVLFAGIGTSVLSLAKLLSHLLQYHPILLWSFFFGLILASIFYIGKEINQWNWLSIIGLILGAAFVVWISTVPPLDPTVSYWFLFLAGMIAICAMILPGISGSFILLILGVYSTVISAIKDLDLLKIMTVGAGAIVGLLSFSNLLKWLLKNYNNTIMAILTGFLLGSLWKIWPWKQDEFVFVKEVGVKSMQDISSDFGSLSAYLASLTSKQANEYKSYIEHNILPQTYEQINPQNNHQLVWALFICAIGFSMIFILEKIAVKKQDV